MSIEKGRKTLKQIGKKRKKLAKIEHETNRKSPNQTCSCREVRELLAALVHGIVSKDSGCRPVAGVSLWLMLKVRWKKNNCTIFSYCFCLMLLLISGFRALTIRYCGVLRPSAELWALPTLAFNNRYAPLEAICGWRFVSVHQFQTYV